MAKFIQEFKEFALKGNVMDMAVGIIIGGAFGKIVSSMVNDILMPPLGLLIGNTFADKKTILHPAVMDPATGEVTKEAITLNWGMFIQNTVDFLIIAFVIFLMIKGINSLRKKQPEPVAEAPADPVDIQLLKEIRDELKKSNQQ
ncbi:large-conductance mechanosensitive channel protein MscL [Porphyromonas pogonae]|uniref:large-conductance mechanosensitive channel protein MscL n=1 Tax=Porphyromonas pogonae TaxID=867595 RepID=UPI002E76825E|nr:large-conductance mechanosensitive channel protein MscL [Porphyromonas pogonae]